MIGSPKDNFRIRLAELRKEKALTKTAVAEMLSLSSQSAVANWESGYSTPDYDNLSLLADILDCSIDYLLGRTDTKNLTEKDVGNSLIEKIDACDEIGQGTIISCIDYQYERCTAVPESIKNRENDKDYIERLFIAHDDPQYTKMMARKPYLKGLKKQSGKSYMEITNFLWSVGYGDEICLAYVMEIFSNMKDTRVPSKKLFSDIEAFLKGEYSVVIEEK